MNELRLVVVGAAGRMGRMLTQIIPDTLGVRLTAALERPGSAALGADSGGGAP
ncbi:MAG: 4-hydroxy-tetrahydrodipicolinate reductase, partial [Methylocystis sp.]